MNLKDISDIVYHEECERAFKMYFDAFDNALNQGVCFSPSVVKDINNIMNIVGIDEAYRTAIKKRLEHLKTEGDGDVSLKAEYEELVWALSLGDIEVRKVDLPKELEDALVEVDFSERDTLVGALREPRQFGVALKRRFYHIPAFYIEEYAIPKYIALYQSQRMFGEEVAGVKYYGEVKKCTPIRRNRIREIPKDSNELYYKFKIKRWERLDSSIKSKELGFVRLFTSFFLLKNVEDVSALAISNAYEFRIYKFLKLANSIFDGENKPAYFSIDGFELLLMKRTIYLCADGKICERYWRSSFEQMPSKLINKIKNDIVTLTDKFENDKEKKDGIQNI